MADILGGTEKGRSKDLERITLHVKVTVLELFGLVRVLIIGLGKSSHINGFNAASKRFYPNLVIRRNNSFYLISF